MDFNELISIGLLFVFAENIKTYQNHLLSKIMLISVGIVIIVPGIFRVTQIIYNPYLHTDFLTWVALVAYTTLGIYLSYVWVLHHYQQKHPNDTPLGYFQ